MANDSPDTIQPVVTTNRPWGLISALFICSLFPFYCGLLILSVAVYNPTVSFFFIVNLLPAFIFLFSAFRIWYRPKASLLFGCSIINLMLLQILLIIINIMIVPSVVTAVPRGKQRQTARDIKLIGVALERYQDQNKHYPQSRNLSELKTALTPLFLASFPELDGWGRPIRYETTADGMDYFLRSAGEDGLFEYGDPNYYTLRDTCFYQNDIVMKSGLFIRSPSGKQMSSGYSKAAECPPLFK